MKLTDIRIRKTNGETGNLKAYAGITIDDAIAIHDIKIIEGENGTFISMPSKKDKKGNYRDIVHPINTETRELIQVAVLEQYKMTAD